MQLFGGHVVNTIEEKQWIRIPLNHYQTTSKQEQKNIELMMEFPIEGLHFYCESFDLTHPFPSVKKVVEYDVEFCWNDWMAKSFEKIGMREWCVVLQQGLATSKVLPKYVTACLITRKSVKNPGVRFFARGLNSIGGVGNEMECELILWTGMDGNKVDWNSFVWRRGTVPIHWSSQLKSQVVRESEVIIRDKPYENSEIYYSSLIDRYGHDHVHPIVIFNMLRCGPKQEEMILSEHFQESLKYVKKSLNLDLKLFNFDWHHNIKQLGPDKSIEGLWSLLKSSLAAIDLNHGSISMYLFSFFFNV